jgi:hypothetical protein
MLLSRETDELSNEDQSLLDCGVSDGDMLLVLLEDKSVKDFQFLFLSHEINLPFKKLLYHLRFKSSALTSKVAFRAAR